MSSRLKQISIIWILRIFLGALLCSSLLAAAEKVELRKDGMSVSKFGYAACSAIDSVEIVLPPKITNQNKDFRAFFRTVKRSGAKDQSSICPKKLKYDRNTEIFDAYSPSIPIRKFVPDSACSSDGSVGNMAICIYEKDGDELLAYSIYGYQTLRAKIGSIEKISASNGAISFKVRVSNTSGPFKVETCIVKTEAITDSENFKKDDCPIENQKISTSIDVNIDGLENNEPYSFKVRLLEPHNPPGKWTEIYQETPIKVAFVLEAYDGKGSPFQFGCSQSGSSSLLFITLAMMILLMIRLKHHVSFKKYLAFVLKKTSGTSVIILVAGVIFFADKSHGDLGQMSFGLLGAMYRPDLDSEQVGQKEIFPFYRCYFKRNKLDKDGPINPLLGIEVDWHLWDEFGSLQLGLGLSYTYVTGQALRIDEENKPDCDNPRENAKVSLHMYQLRPQLTYIFDPFVEYFPLAPYIRGSLIGHGYMFFQNQKGDYSGGQVKPYGFSFGYQAAIGAMLMLDFLEPSAVLAARGQGFFEHVYLKAELSYTKIDNFGQEGFQFSAKDIMGSSWPLMWTFGLVFELPH
jgi:hypothetical protein